MSKQEFEITGCNPQNLASTEPHSSELSAEPSTTNHAPESPSAVGPGIIESLFWFVGVLVVHVIGSMVGIATLMIWHIVKTGQQPGSRLQWDKVFGHIVADYGFELVSFEMAIFVVIAVSASLLRMSPHPLKTLSISPIPTRQLVLIVTGALPLAFFCGGLHELTTGWWDMIVTNYPVLERFKLSDTNDMVKKLSESTTLLGLWLVIALAPAISEEIVFRGVIGRGLTARYGIPFGVVASSILFGLVHIHPAHALAVMPMGIYIHVAYLSSGSFYAPVLVHLLNNSFAAMMLSLSDNLEVPGVNESAKSPTWLIILSLVVGTLTVASMWRNRRAVSPASNSLSYAQKTSPFSDRSFVAAASLGAIFICTFSITVALSLKS